MKTTLRQICEIVSDKLSVNELINTNLTSTYISTENMLPNKGGVVASSSVPTTGKVTAYKTGDVLVSNIRPYFKKIWFASNDGGCSNDVLVFRAKKDISPEYLHYVLADNSFFDYAHFGFFLKLIDFLHQFSSITHRLPNVSYQFPPTAP